MIKVFLLIFGLVQTSVLQAQYNSEFGGWTEIIACPVSSWDANHLYHEASSWGESGTNISYTSPADWWAYGDEDASAFDCDSWINGSIVGGASYEPGKVSFPQGVTVRINTNWWDFTHTDFSINCGHQYVSTYVWGWRRNANSWSFEFVTAHTLSSYLDDDGTCRFKGAGNPSYRLQALQGFAFGETTLLIADSPYAVLYTKTQANSHYRAGCGKQECLHAVRVAVTYEGGPGAKQPKSAQHFMSEELIGNTEIDSALKQVAPSALHPASKHFDEHLTTGDEISLQPGWKELAYAVENRLIASGRANGIGRVLPIDELMLKDALDANPLLACEISYIQTAAAMTRSSQDMDMGDFPALKMSSYPVFVKDCLNLPVEVQKCQVFEYIKEHYSDCQVARGEYSAQLKMQASIQ